MRSLPLVRSIVLSVMVAGLTSPAFAQGLSRTEVSAGYQLARSEGETIPAGWYADVAVNVNRAFAFVGEVNGLYQSLDESLSASGVQVSLSADARIHAFMGGVRLSARQSPRLVPYGQVLIGGARLSGTIRGTSPSLFVPITVSESQTEPILQIGGGLNIAISQALGVRLAVDHIRIFTDEDSGTGFRVATGLAFRF